METKNISRQDTQVKEYLERGYAELEKGNWEFAKISFDKVITLDANCGKAYVGRALAEIHCRSIDDATLYGFVFNLSNTLFIENKKHNAICNDEKLRLKLCEHIYKEAQEMITVNIDRALYLFRVTKNCLGGYKDSKELCGLIYKEACRKITEDKNVSGAVILFKIIEENLGGYKDSKEKIRICNDYLELDEKVHSIVKGNSYNKVIERSVISDINDFNNKMNNARKGLKYGILFLLWIFLSLIPLYLIAGLIPMSYEAEWFVVAIWAIVAIVGHIVFGILTFKYGYGGSYGYAILAIIFVFWGELLRFAVL